MYLVKLVLFLIIIGKASGDEVLSIEITDVIPGLNNTEFVYKIIKLEEDFLYITGFHLHIDPDKAHHVNVLGCSDATPGLVVFVLGYIQLK